MITIRIGW